METIAIIIFGGGCFAFGMYTNNKISDWIEYKIKKINKKNEKQ